MSATKLVCRTERLVIRGLKPEDTEWIYSTISCDPDVMRHLEGEPLSRKAHDRFFRWLYRDQQQAFGTTFWAVERSTTNEPLGLCGLVIVDEPDSTVLGSLEIGWRFARKCWGEGYATEAATACLWQAFEDRRTLRVVSRTVSENKSSLRVMEKLQMRRDDRLDYITRGASSPFIMHVLTYADWKQVTLDDTRT